MMNGEFELSLPIAKADPGDSGQWRFAGVASTSNHDRQGDVLTEKAIAGFKTQLGVELCVGSHESASMHALSAIGKVDNVGGDLATLDIEGFLYKWHPEAEVVNRALNAPIEEQPDWKLSIGGRVPNKAAVRRRYDVGSGSSVREIDEVVLDHVLLCRASSAVNQDTSFGVGKVAADWLEPIFKAAAEIESGTEMVDSDEPRDNRVDEAIPLNEEPPPSVSKTEEGNSPAEGTMSDEIQTVNEGTVPAGLFKDVLDKLTAVWPHAVGKSEEPAVDPTPEPDPDPAPAPEYVTAEQVKDIAKSVFDESFDVVKAAVATTISDEVAKAFEVHSQPAVVEEPVVEEAPVDEPVAEPEPVETEPSELEKQISVLQEQIDAIAKAASAPGVSEQLPIDTSSNRDSQPDEEIDLVGKMMSDPRTGFGVASLLRKTQLPN